MHAALRNPFGAGLVALALLVAAELSVVGVVRGQTIGEYVASRDPVSGLVYSFSLAVFAALPVLLRLREKR